MSHADLQRLSRLNGDSPASDRLLRGLMSGAIAGVTGGLATGFLVAYPWPWAVIGNVLGFVIGLTIGLANRRPKHELFIGVALISTVIGPALTALSPILMTFVAMVAINFGPFSDLLRDLLCDN